MNINLPYGKSDLTINVPDANLKAVMKMKAVPCLENIPEEIIKSLENPIGTKPFVELIKSKSKIPYDLKVCIVISDLTRPVPNKIILKILLDTLEEAGIRRENIMILIATGIHRPNRGNDLIELVGEDIVRHYNILNHVSENEDDMLFMGEIKDGRIPVFLNKYFCNADLKIITGLIEPHLLSGFSGGRKSILPGISSLETMKYMHGFKMVDNKNCRSGVLENNPFHKAATDIAKKTGVDFIVNVTVDLNKNVTGIFAGDLEKAFYEGTEFVRSYTSCDVDEEADIVITTGGGYPLDKLLYQSIKGAVSASHVIKKNGTIILAANCEDGIGGNTFKNLLFLTHSPDEFITKIQQPGFFAKDQWMVQHLCEVLEKAEIMLYSDNIENSVIEKCLMTPINSVEEGLKKALEIHGKDAKVVVMPQGPHIISEIK